MSSFYPRSTQKVLVSIASIFRDIRYPIILPDNIVADRIVPIRLSTGDKLVSELKKPRSEGMQEYSIPVPIIGISISALDPIEDDQHSVLEQIISVDGKQLISTPMPNAATIDIAVFAERTSQLLDIIEQIITMFRPNRLFPMISFKFKDGSYIKKDMNIVLQSPSIEISDDVGAEDRKTFSTNVTLTCTFDMYRFWKNNDKPKVFDGYHLDPHNQDNENYNPNYAYQSGEIFETSPIPYVDEKGLIDFIDVSFEDKYRQIYEEMRIE